MDPPLPAMYIWPSAGISRWLAICGELIAVSPTFLTTTPSCEKVAGKVWEMLTEPSTAAISYATCTSVWPGGNGPWTVTRAPLTLANGDEPCMMPAPVAPFGTSNTNGAPGFTGTRAVFSMSRR